MTSSKRILFCFLFLCSAVMLPVGAIAVEGSEGLAATDCRASDWGSQTSFRGVVETVSDGDTIRVRKMGTRNAYKIRFLSIDTPETHYQGQSQGVWAERASRRMQELLPLGVEVEVELDQERCDSYKRVLGYVHHAGEMVNERMVREGLAVNYCISPNLKHCDVIGDAAAESIRRRAGMFSDPRLELPYDFRRRVEGRPSDKYVGNRITHQVRLPAHQDEVPVGDRVFFMKASAIRPPYSLVE